MTLKTLIESHATSVMLNADHFAESVTRELAGVATDTEVHTALVDAESATANVTNGRAFVFAYQMWVAEAQEVLEVDTYMVREERCKVVKIGKAQNGMTPVWLQRVEGVRTEARRSRSIR